MIIFIYAHIDRRCPWFWPGGVADEWHDGFCAFAISLSMIHNVQKIGFALWRKEVMADVMSSEFPLLLDFLFDEYWALTTPDANCHTRVHRRASWDSNLRHLTRWTWCGTTGNYQKILWHNPQCHMYSPNLSLFILCLHIYIYICFYIDIYWYWYAQMFV